MKRLLPFIIIIYLLNYFPVFSQIPTNGLVAFYPFNGDTNDESGNGNNGSIVGGVYLANDRFGNAAKAMYFNGTDGYIQVPNSTSLQSPVTSLSISAWIYIDSWPGLAAAGIVHKTNTTNYGQYGLNYQAWETPGIHMASSSAAGVAPAVLDFKKWYHIILTYNSGTIKIYLNGTLLSTASSSANLTVDTNPLTIGLDSPGGNEFLKGLLDDVRIYNRELNEPEVKTLYHENGYAQVTDIDGNIYETVKIGTQEWMKENLKTTHYQNGDAIPYVTDGSCSGWSCLSTGAFCYYNNNPSTYRDIYGALYNWYAVADIRNLCPTDWHIPDRNEWSTLVTYLGGVTVSGGKLKETGTLLWASPNTDASNESGFSARPGGGRTDAGAFENLTYGGFFYSSDYISGNYGEYVMFNTGEFFEGSNALKSGLSVRCLKNDLNTSLVAYYPFNANANDESGNGNNGTVLEALPVADRHGNTNSAYYFDGTNDNITIADAPSLRGGDNFSISVWIKTMSISGSLQIIAKGNNTQPNHWGIAYSGDLKSIYFQFRDNNSTFPGCEVSYAKDLGDNRWHHISGIFENKILKLYVDGILLTSKDASGLSYSYNNTDPVTIGYHNLASYYYYFNGSIDDVRIYNRALSEIEVKELYNNGGWPPSVTDFTPKSAIPGSSVTISGNNFNPDPAGNIVYFGPVKAEVLSASFSELTVKVPVGATFDPIKIHDLSTNLACISSSKFIPLPSVSSTEISVEAPVSVPVLSHSYGSLLPSFADLDGDGKTDIIVNDGNTNSITIKRNVSDKGIFRFENALTLISEGIYAYSYITGDIDGDSKPDIMVTKGSQNYITIFRNESTPGNLSFSLPIKITVNNLPLKIGLGDFDKDGKSDLVIAYSFFQFITILRNISTPGSIAFESGITISTGAHYCGHVITSDINSDGLIDIICSSNYSGSILIFKNLSYNEGDFVFATPHILSSVPAICGLYSGDVDGDGKEDLLGVSNTSNNFAVFRNLTSSGSLSFAASETFSTGASPWGLTMGDLNGDSKPDIAVGCYADNELYLFKNSSNIGSVVFENPKIIQSTYASIPGFYDIDNDKAMDIVGLTVIDGISDIYIFRNNIQDVPASGLVAYYPFNGNANDESWNGNNAAVSGSTLTSDRFGNSASSYSFDGINDGINYGTLNIPVNSFSASLWFNPKAFESSDELLYDANATNGFNIFLEPGNELNFMVIASSSSANRIRYNLGQNVLNQWIHVVAVSDNGNIKLYINGTLQVSQDGIIGVNSTSALFSGYDYVANNYYFNGHLDDIRLYNRSLSADEVLSLYHENGWGLQPTITSFTPTSGTIGTLVTITGTNFSPVLSENIVWFGAVRANVTASTTTHLTVTVPAGATYQPISVTVNGLTGCSSKPFNVTFPSSQVIDASAFETKIGFETGIQPFYSASGDVDGDGKPDLIIANFGAGTISVYRNTSTSGTIELSSFSPKVDFVTGGNPRCIAIGDIDGDGKTDIAVSIQNSNVIGIFRNISTTGSISSGSFSQRVEISSGNYPASLVIGDIDLDGKNDLIVANYNNNTVSVIKNIGSPGSITTASFSPKVDFPSGANPWGVVTGDIDGDSKPDIVTANNTAGSVSILRNVSSPGSFGANSFSTKIDLVTGNTPYYITLGDIDGDERSDLIVTNYNSNTVTVIRNISSPGSLTTGSFADKIDFTTGSNPYNVGLSDIDGDGKPDITVINSGSNSVGIFKNTSTSGSIDISSFAPRIDFNIGTPAGGLVVGDIDGDGKPDIAAPNYGSNLVYALRNNLQYLPPPVIGIVNQPTCSLATGNVTLNGLPSTGTWTLTRNPGGATTQGTGTSTTISGLTEGTYSYTVTNSLGGTSASSADIVINAQPPTPSAPTIGTITQPSCSVASGSVQLSGLPASGSWTLTRSPGAVVTNGTGTTTDISGLAEGTYTYTVTNSEGCTSTSSSDIIISPYPSTPGTPVVGTITQPTCSSATGKVDISGLPASGSWTLTQSPGAIETTGSGTDATITSLVEGTYTYTVTNSSGCSSAASSEIVINAVPLATSAPTVGVIVQPDCNSVTGSVTLTGLPSSGTWTITRSPGGNIFTGTGESTTIESLPAGTYSFAVNGSSGCISNSSSDVTINAQPPTPSAPVAGIITQPSCTQRTGSVTLTGLPSSGTWTLTRTADNSTLNGSGTTTTLTDLSEGLHSYSVTNSNGCVSVSSADIVINVPPEIPAIPAAVNIVQPTCRLTTGSITIGNLPPSGDWILNAGSAGTSSGNGTNTTLSGLSPGTYSFTVTNAAGCVSSTLSNITVDPVPKGYIPVIEKKWNTVLICYNLNNEFTTWQWFRGTTPLTGETEKAFYYSGGVQGFYRVLATDKDGCQNYSNYIEILQGTKSVTVYPNPSDNYITLSIEDNSRGKSLISLFSETGLKVKEYHTEKTGDNLDYRIPTDNLEEGIYIIRIIINQTETYHSRFVIAR